MDGPRRVVIKTNDEGRSFADEATPYVSFDTMHHLWLTTSTPARPEVDELTDTPPPTRIAQPPQFGSLFELCTFPPGATSPMHKTATIDYVVVLSGEIDMHVQDGPPVHLNAGDCLVQLATVHRWANRGAEPCTLAVVCISTATAPLSIADIEVVE